MEKSLVIGLIIAGLVILIVGAGLGIAYKTWQDNIFSDKLSSTINSLNLKVFPPLIVSAKVKEISEKRIELSKDTDVFSVNIDQNTKTTYFTYKLSVDDKNVTSAIPVEKKIDIGDIDIGQEVNVTIKLLSDGTMLAKSIVVNVPPAQPIKK